MTIKTVDATERLSYLRSAVNDEHKIFIGKYDEKRLTPKTRDKQYKWILITEVFILLDEPVFLDHINLVVKDLKTLRKIKKGELIVGSSKLHHYKRKNGTISCGFCSTDLYFQKAEATHIEMYSKLFYDLYYSGKDGL